MTSQQGLFSTPARRRIGRARRGLDVTIVALRDTGRLERVDEALIALARVAADEVDAACADREESRFTRATLIGRYHSVLTSVVEREGDPVLDESLADLFAEMGDPPET